MEQPPLTHEAHPWNASVKVAIMLAGVLALAFFVYRMTVINKEQQNAYLQTFGRDRPTPEAVIPHSQTTLPAQGYTANLNEPPYNWKGYVPPHESGHKCSVILDRQERMGVVPMECPPGTDKIGFMCYSKCPDGMSAHPNFPDQCQRCRDFSSSCEFLDMIHQKRQAIGPATECPANHQRFGGLCFPPCPAGYTPNGNICLKCGQ